MCHFCMNYIANVCLQLVILSSSDILLHTDVTAITDLTTFVCLIQYSSSRRI